jgi:predicted transcriptional regulator
MKVMNRLTARDLMKSDILTVGPSMTLADLERFLVEHKITGAPVVDEEGKIIGVVSRSDIVKQLVVEHSLAGYVVDYQSDAGLLGGADAERESSLEAAISADHLRSQTVGDVMTRSVISVTAETPLPELVREMHSRHVHRLIVTEGDVPVGIVTTIDLIARIADGSIS